MNKKGYTLAEALVTLGIIGIIAALVVPAANKARPNENKIKFLQTYDAIETQIKNFTQNSRYFPTCQNGLPDPVNPGNRITRCFPDYPLFNTSAGVGNILSGIMNNSVTSDDKLCYLLADAMSTTTPMDDRCPRFVTPNGVTVNVNSTFEANSCIFQIGFQVVDGDGDAINPTSFLIYVTADGNIYPGDRATAYYLATRKDTRGNLDVPAGTINAVLDSKYGQHDNFDSIVSDESKIRVIFSN